MALLARSDGSRAFFYIGVDNRLHQATSLSSDPAVWTMQASKPRYIWPPAHPSNSKLTITSHRGASSLRLYYHTPDGVLAELSYDSNIWAPFTIVHGNGISLSHARDSPDDDAVPEGHEDRDDADYTDDTPESSAINPPSSGDATGGLTLAEQILVGLGVTLLGLCLIFSCMFFCKNWNGHEDLNSRHVCRNYAPEQPVDNGAPLRSRRSVQSRPYTQFGDLDWSAEQIEMDERGARQRARSF